MNVAVEVVLKDTAIYMRVSTSQQRELSQESAINSLIAERGFEPEQIEWYVDHGVSATKKAWKERPEFQRLIRDITSGAVKRLIVFARDRLCRNAYEWLRLSRILREYRVQVIFAMPGHAPFTKDVVVEMIYAHMAYEEAERIKLRTRQATYTHPAKLYGYITRTHSGESRGGSRTYIIDTSTAEKLRRCFNSVAFVAESSEVAKVLSQCATLMGVSIDRVCTRLTDVRYTGSVRNRDGESIFPMIIAEDLFERVHAVLNDFVSARMKQREDALCTPICEICQSPMQIVEVLHEPCWKCAKGHRVSIKVSQLNDIVRSKITELTANIDVFYIQKTCVAQIKKTRRQLIYKLHGVERHLSRLAELIVLHHSTHVKKVRLREQYDRSVQEKKTLMNDIDALTDVLDTLETGLDEYSQAIKARLQEGSDLLPSLVKIFITHIVVGKQLVEIGLKHSDLLNSQVS